MVDTLCVLRNMDHVYIKVMHRCSKNRPEHSQLHITEEQEQEAKRGKKEDEDGNEEAMLVQTKEKDTLKMRYVGFVLHECTSLSFWQ